MSYVYEPANPRFTVYFKLSNRNFVRVDEELNADLNGFLFLK